MNIILCIYSKSGPIDGRSIRNTITDFTLSGKRNMKYFSSERLFLATSTGDKNSCNNLIENSDGQYAAVVGGNIYDYKYDLQNLIKDGQRIKNTESLAEYLAGAFRQRGESFLKNINGIFAAVIYDRKTDNMIVCNDRYGIYPLFLYEDKDVVIICSEYEPITKYKHFDNCLNLDAVAEYFVFGVPIGDKTFFQNIRQISPATILKVSGDRTTIDSYDDVSIAITDRSIESYKEETAGIIHSAVQSRMYGRHQIDCALSGGADTRLILSNLDKQQRQNASFYTCRSHYLEDKEDRDVVIASRIARRAGIKLKIIRPVPQDNEHFSTSFFKRKRLIAFDINRLGGTCGGEFLGGNYLKVSPVQENMISEASIDKKMHLYFHLDFLKKVVNPYFTLQSVFNSIKAENHDFRFAINFLTRGSFTTIYGGSGSGWLDPCNHALKKDSPFWDQRLLDILLSIPPAYLKKYKLYNMIYRDCFPEFNDVPTNSRLARRKDSCILPMEEGVEPKLVRKNKCYNAFNAYKRSHKTWNKNIYNENVFSSCKAAGDSKFINAFTDFEAWYRVFQ